MQSRDILVTGFRPFAGRSVNGAETIARSLMGEPLGARQVQICLLRVCWQSVASFVDRSLTATPYSLVIALGEANRPRVCFESQADGACAGADVGGRAPPPSQPGTSLSARLRFDTAWFDAPDGAVVESNDAGTYLCNRLLYLALRDTNLKVGFVHVPIQGAQSDAEYLQRYRPAIMTLLDKNTTWQSS